MTAIHSPDTAINGAGTRRELTDGHRLTARQPQWSQLAMMPRRALALATFSTAIGSVVGSPLSIQDGVVSSGGIGLAARVHRQDGT
jgi:hypothetical protein